MGGEWEKHFKKTWAPNSRFVVYLNQNTSLANVVGDVRELGKDLTKQDHIVIVGGAGKSLHINEDYSTDKDINFIAEGTSNTNVGFVNLLRKYDKPWMNRRIRSVNF
jgi:hypothetical protein